MKKATRDNAEGVRIGNLDATEMKAAVEVIVRGMRDNPVNVAALGEDATLREKGCAVCSARWRQWRRWAATATCWPREGLTARYWGCGMVPPGRCQPGLGRQLRLAPTILALGPRSAGRTMKWLRTWSKPDPDERHWHLAPVAVDAHLQGRGVGSKLMRDFCARMDAAGEIAYLETDKEINVRFYEKFGFEVVAEVDVLGAPNWFMTRRPRN